jgi:metal-responsive CopG/Arc/MetJ family transcriptional regulator
MVEQKSKEAENVMFITTISLNQEIHRKLKHLAIDKGISVRDLIRRAIEEYLGPGVSESSGRTSLDLNQQ